MTISHLLPKSSEMQVFDERFGPTQHGRDNSEDIQHRYLLPRVEPSILAARGICDERLVGLEVELTTAPGSSGVRFARAGCRHAPIRAPSPANMLEVPVATRTGRTTATA